VSTPGQQQGRRDPGECYRFLIGCDHDRDFSRTKSRQRHDDGELTSVSVPPVRSVLGKVPAECLTAVIVELSGLRCEATELLSVLPAACHQAQKDRGVPVLLCPGSTAITRGLIPYRAFVGHYDDQ
jgi:hypothetical protein